MTTNGHPGRPPWPAAAAWAHAVLFLVFAIACYLAPQSVFGDAAWQPLPRLAVGLLAAALLALAVVLIGALRSASPRALRRALLAVLVVDVQVPVLLSLHPAGLEYIERDVGIPWPVAPLLFVALVAVTIAGLPAAGEEAAADAG
jgi:hypothetical protein